MNRKSKILIFAVIAVLIFAVVGFKMYTHYHVFWAKVYLDNPLNGRVAMNYADLNQKLDETSASARYMLGTRLEVGDNVYRYACFGTNTITGENVYAGSGLASNDTVTLFTKTTHPAICDSSGNGTINISGASTITLTLEATPTNHFRWGKIIFKDSVTHELWTTFIISSTCTTATNDTITLTVLDSLPTTFVTGDTVWAIRNKYGNLTVPNDTGTYALEGIVAVNQIYNASALDLEGRYAWVQTWGDAALKFATNGLKGGEFERTVYHKGKGEFSCPDSSGVLFATGNDTVMWSILQPVGFIIEKTKTKLTNLTAPLVQLQISR